MSPFIIGKFAKFYCRNTSSTYLYDSLPQHQLLCKFSHWLFTKPFLLIPPPVYFAMSSGRRTDVPALSVCSSQLLAVITYAVKEYSEQESSSRPDILTGAYLDKQIFSCQIHRESFSLNNSNCYGCSLQPGRT